MGAQRQNQERDARPAGGELSLSAPLARLAWLERFLSIPLIFGLLGAAIFWIAWNRGIALLYALFAVLIGATLFSLIGPRLILRPALIRLRLPEQASVGDDIVVELTVLPQTWPRKRHLLELRSPYPFAPEQHVFLPVCSSELARAQRVRCTRRGLFRWQDAAVASGYPLGMITLARRWPMEPAAIRIYPRIYPGSGLALPMGSARSSADLQRPAPSSGQELFRDVREYRRGDNPRHIHWRNSARHGELMVKQFDALTSSDTWIVLDLDPANHAGHGEDHSFERAVEIAASIAVQHIRAGLRCGLAAGMQKDGAPVLLLAPNGGHAHLHAILDSLAAVRADCAVPYAKVLDGMAAHQRPGQQWILFQHGEQAIAAPAFLRRQNPPFWFRFDTASFDVGDAGATGRGNAGGDADADAAQRAPALPRRVSDGFAIARDTDLARIFL